MYEDLMPTGIAGLDQVLDGGLVRGNSLLIEGPPGSGKTTLAVQILYNGLAKYEEPGVLISFEEFPRQLYRQCASFGLDLEKYEKAGALRVIWTTPDRVVGSLTGREDLLGGMVKDMGAKRVLIDSITHFQRVTESDKELREMLYALSNNLKLQGVNTLLVKELARDDYESIAFEEYVVDASIRVGRRTKPNDGHVGRFIEVRKTRGRAHVPGNHPFEFTEEGISVYPQCRAEDYVKLVGPAEAGPAENGRVSTGNAEFDEMLGGGLLPGSTALLVGYAGTGKSVGSLFFLEEGLKLEEPCLLVSLRKQADKYCEFAESFGIDLQRAEEKGHLNILTFMASGLCVEKMLLKICEEMNRTGARRVVFDSLHDLHMALDDARRLQEKVELLSRIFEASGATTVFVAEADDRSGQVTDGDTDFSYLVDVVARMAIRETSKGIARDLTITKMQGSDHLKRACPYTIDSTGMHIDLAAAASEASS